MNLQQFIRTFKCLVFSGRKRSALFTNPGVSSSPYFFFFSISLFPFILLIALSRLPGDQRMLLLLSGCPFCLKCFLMSDKFCLFLFVPVSVFLKIFASFSGSVHFLGFVDRTTSLLFQITSSKVCFRYDIRYYVKRARHGSLWVVILSRSHVKYLKPSTRVIWS